jgi:hypothetical protein
MLQGAVEGVEFNVSNLNRLTDERPRFVLVLQVSKQKKQLKQQNQTLTQTLFFLVILLIVQMLILTAAALHFPAQQLECQVGIIPGDVSMYVLAARPIRHREVLPLVLKRIWKTAIIEKTIMVQIRL